MKKLPAIKKRNKLGLKRCPDCKEPLPQIRKNDICCQCGHVFN